MDIKELAIENGIKVDEDKIIDEQQEIKKMAFKVMNKISIGTE